MTQRNSWLFSGFLLLFILLFSFISFKGLNLKYNIKSEKLIFKDEQNNKISFDQVSFDEGQKGTYLFHSLPGVINGSENLCFLSSSMSFSIFVCGNHEGYSELDGIYDHAHKDKIESTYEKLKANYTDVRLIAAYDDTGAYPGMPTKFLRSHTYELDSKYANWTVYILLMPTYSDASAISEIEITSGSDYMKSLLYDTFTYFALSITTLLVLSGAFMVSYFTSDLALKIKFTALSFMGMGLASWTLLSSPFIYYFYENTELLHFINSLIVMLIPFLIAQFLDAEVEYEHRHIKQYFLFAAFIEVITCCITLKTGTIDIRYFDYITYSIILISIIITIYMSIKNSIFRKENKIRKVMPLKACASGSLIVGAVLDIIRSKSRYSQALEVNSYDYAFCTRIGLMFFAYYVVLTVVKSFEARYYQLSKSAEYKITAYHDPLSGIENKSAYNEHIKWLVNEYYKCKSKNILLEAGIIYIDLNGLKIANDSEGHNAGDELIKSAAKILEKISNNAGSRVYRTGGDEFIIIYHSMIPEDVQLQCVQITKEIQRLMGEERCSYGFYVWNGSESFKEAEDKADSNMQQMKNAYYEKHPDRKRDKYMEEKRKREKRAEDREKHFDDKTPTIVLNKLHDYLDYNA